ncbi:TPR domain protein [Anaerovibrio sp. JC8]|uniref:tetratricopeptide repeat protein n=1 Tax=Anaerovibrio sp. JC8 TaxID=1240085 RepID=UPI000A0D06B8|nr:tetratricopeptide repeat protein [Anaerovibrio sp. JC8]ORT99321.1 TPR domain protein [Anaerovibrio sp. JC8]
MRINKKIGRKIIAPLMAAALLVTPSFALGAEDFGGLDDSQVYELGNSFMEKHDYSRALEAYDHILSTNSGWAVVYTSRARAKFLLGDRAGAEEDLNTALSYDANLPDAYYVKGSFQYMENDFAGAEASFNRALELYPDYVDAITVLGKLYFDTGRENEAVKAMSLAVEKSPTAMSYVNRAIMYSKIPDISSANLDYNKALELDPKCVTAYLNRGMLFVEQRKFSAARSDFDAAISVDPKNVNAYINRGYLYMESKQFEEAMADFNKALELQPDNALAYNARGLANRKVGSYEEAMRDFDKCIELAPDYELGYQSRAMLHRDMGDFDKALTDFQKILELTPDNPVSHYDEGCLYLEMHQPDKALELFTKAVELDGGRTPQFMINKAVAEAYLGQNEAAEADFTKAISLNDKFVLSYLYRGIFYNSVGEKSKALGDIDRVLLLDPENQQAQELRKKLK